MTANKKICSDLECDLQAKARGLCMKHYQRWRKANGVTPTPRGVHTWYCEDCTLVPQQGRFPCTDCCGYTASATKVVSGVKTAHGKPNGRCLP